MAFKNILLSVVFGCVITSNAAANNQLNCLALNIYHEARGESPQGQSAVAAVTMNRVASSKFPSSICSVVWQRKQFSWTRIKDNYLPDNKKAWNSALSIARSTIDGKVNVAYKNILYFHNKSSSPYWSKSKRLVTSVGNHLFYSK